MSQTCDERTHVPLQNYFDRLVGAGKKQSSKLYPECLRGLEVQNEIELIRLLNGRHAMNTTTAPSEFMSAGSGASLATGYAHLLVAHSHRRTPAHSVLALEWPRRLSGRQQLRRLPHFDADQYSQVFANRAESSYRTRLEAIADWVQLAVAD
jgi:hypothetical protein